ncbi:ABC transporter [Legionella sp. PATHC035]|uniref:ABC transporter n=1 Tax=Legionella sp. PATHC035 TaxID=2992040 RepID=UPI002244CB10|nr:ABC transporter [Legionella sp. PATHC035]MCW8408027.1 ABC transporter [Legionella sp. PATHC035]
MKDKELRKKLLNKCIEIKDSINRKIPLPANRYEEFEQIERSKMKAYEEARRAEAPEDEQLESCIYEMEYLELHDKEYEAHERYVKQKQIEYHIFESINERFKEFCLDNQVKSPHHLTPNQKQSFKQIILKQSSILCEQIARTLKLLGRESSDINVTEIDDYLEKNADSFIQILCQGEELTINDKELAYRFKKTVELIEHRDAFQKQHNRENALLFQGKSEKKVREAIQKSTLFAIAEYFDRPEISTGFCQEHTTIALKRLYDEHIIQSDTTVEKVTIDYFDDEGNPADGHTFLVLDRNPNSPLNDISQWEGILLDPWNGIACLTEDYDSLPYFYISYPKGAKWEAIQFTDDDYTLRSAIRDANQYYQMTGNSEIEKRRPLVMEEHQLHSLDEVGFEETKTFLTELINKLRPPNFEESIDIFITTTGDKLVNTLAGLTKPAIVIHSDFLKQMQNGVYTVEELEFALANELLYMKHEGVGIYYKISASEQFKLDKLTIEQCHNIPAGISYLRKSIHFQEQHKWDVSHVHQSYLVHDYQLAALPDYHQRIKNLLTLLAIKENERNEKQHTSLPNAILKAVAPIQREIFFKKECDACKSTVAKLKFLESKLAELTVELLPYEITSSVGIKVRDFCHILYAMDINLNDAEVKKTAEELIQRAFNLRIPAFEQIYLALVHQHFTGRNSLTRNVQLPPLGPFRVLNDAFDAFVKAKSFAEAKEAAESLNALLENLINHLKHPHGRARLHTYQFEETHQRMPVGKERFFGSVIGEHIKWNTFAPQNEGTEVPWSSHLAWAQKDESSLIAETLWRLGVTGDHNVWSLLPDKRLLSFVLDYDETKPITTLPPGLDSYNGYYSEAILTFLSDKVIKNFDVNFEMFFSGASFEDKLKQYYDLNRLVLIKPSEAKARNVDNLAVQFLLTEFTNIAINGTPEEQAVVKGFFLGREDKRDLEHLLQAANEVKSTLDYNAPYVQFVINQEFQGKKFDLFTTEEQLKFLRASSMSLYEIPPQAFIAIFRLPFDSFSLDCLEQLLPLTNKTIEDLTPVYSIAAVFLQEHIKKYGNYEVLSKETIALLKLAMQFVRNPVERASPFKSFLWNLPQETSGTNHLTAHDLILIYRMFDSQLLFPSPEVQEHFARLLIQRIKEISDPDERIQALEKLLFVENAISLPISSISLRNEAIEQLVKDLRNKYGQDDRSQEYREKMIAVIDHLYENMAKRDVTLMLSRLANSIESQWDVTEHLGILLEPDKYLSTNQQEKIDFSISSLAAVSRKLSEDKNDINEFLEFISSPISRQTTDRFSSYLLSRQKINDLAKLLGYSGELEKSENEKPGTTALLLRSFYAQFWDVSLEERAVIVDHLLIPASKVKTAAEMEDAYQEGFSYVAHKLFPHAETDKEENFAYALLKAYLDSADKYIRGHLLAGMLVATNQSSGARESPSAGKKLAMLCEHMGPAYVKLAQAVHSHPNTPEAIRRDLEHLKGRANPPHRWQLWRLLREVVSRDDRKMIKRVGALLGSASYNLALEAELENGQDVVLLMLREHAAKNAQDGFIHLQKTIESCAHVDMEPIRESILSIIQEAKELSKIEMDRNLSEQQNLIATKLYTGSITVNVDDKPHSFTLNPAHLLKSGEGYRFIERIYGTEFNELPNQTTEDKEIRRAIAKAIITVELINILQGGCFDSDRHGNQLRHQNHQLGLYDFGEMSLQPPSEVELKQLAKVLSDLPRAALKNRLFHTNFDLLLTEHIRKALKAGEPTRYLMRIRKGLLALRDFQKELTTEELIEVFQQVNASEAINPKVKAEVASAIRMAEYMEDRSKDYQRFVNKVVFFRSKVDSLFKRNIPHEETHQDRVSSDNDKQIILAPGN